MALKEIEILETEDLSLITNEIALHENLDHINIVKILKSECQEKKCYIYLEYIPGNSLFVKNYHTYLTLMFFTKVDNFEFIFLILLFCTYIFFCYSENIFKETEAT